MLQGKIAAIVDNESVVINMGSEQGVSPGMTFTAVYEAQRILDPDNPKNTLGTLTFEIAKLRATNVQDKMTFCKILDPYINRGIEIPLVPFITSESKVDPEATQIGGPENLKLKIGTIVRQVESSAK